MELPFNSTPAVVTEGKLEQTASPQDMNMIGIFAGNQAALPMKCSVDRRGLRLFVPAHAVLESIANFTLRNARTVQGDQS